MSFEKITLSRGGEYNMTSPLSSSEEGLNLYISNPDVVQLPECGTITFRFKRGPVSMTEGTASSQARASVDLTLTEIVDCTADEEEETKESRAHEENEIDRLFELARKEEEAEKAKEESAEKAEDEESD